MKPITLSILFVGLLLVPAGHAAERQDTALVLDQDGLTTVDEPVLQTTPLASADDINWSWPVPWLSEQQLAEVQACDIEELAEERYASSLSLDDLPSIDEMGSDCDLAVLLRAYAMHLGDDAVPGSVRSGALQLAASNYGFLLDQPLIHNYFGWISLGATLPGIQQDITDIHIKYSIYGDGARARAYQVLIRDANKSPWYELLLDSRMTRQDILELSYTLDEIDTDLTQALAPALTDFLPVNSLNEILPFGEAYSWFLVRIVTDYYPEWDVTLTFEDGSTLELFSAGNLLQTGAPWFITIDDQVYMQYSAAFAEAVSELLIGVGLPFGGDQEKAPYRW